MVSEIYDANNVIIRLNVLNTSLIVQISFWIVIGSYPLRQSCADIIDPHQAFSRTMP